MQPVLFECDDVLEAVYDAAADLQVARALAEPAPALKRAWADLPAARKFDLVEVAYQMRRCGFCRSEAGGDGRNNRFRVHGLTPCFKHPSRDATF